jgi:hypothetical protein
LKFPRSLLARISLSRLLNIFLKSVLLICLNGQLGAVDDFKKCKPGPWGDLEFRYIYLEPPENNIRSQSFDVPSPVWNFENCEEKDFRRLLVSADLSTLQIQQVVAQGHPNSSIHGFVVTPDDKLILGLTKNQRSKLYKILSGNIHNFFQANPFNFPADKADEWFENSNLPNSLIKQITALTYVEGKTLLFSDIHLVLSLTKSIEEKTKIIQTLSRKPTLFVKLVLPEQVELDKVVKYWGVGNRENKVYPILDAVHRSKNPQINILMLLPTFARNHLYTFPEENSHNVENVKYDCFWSSLNFFSDIPDERFADPQVIAKVSQTDYEQISGDPQLGDLLILTNNKGEGIHSAVYITKEIVFTKNGSSNSQPWILEKLDDLLSTYIIDDKLNVHTYRKKLSFIKTSERFPTPLSILTK